MNKIQTKKILSRMQEMLESVVFIVGAFSGKNDMIQSDWIGKKIAVKLFREETHSGILTNIGNEFIEIDNDIRIQKRFIVKAVEIHAE